MSKRPGEQHANASRATAAKVLNSSTFGAFHEFQMYAQALVPEGILDLEDCLDMELSNFPKKRMATLRILATIGGVMSDKIVKNAAEDTGAFGSLFAAFFPKVRAMLMRQGADRETAEEIAQDTMFAVWRKTHQFSEDKGTVSAWIYTIARNLRIDRARKNAAWQRFYSEFETVERLHEEAAVAQEWAGEKNDVETALHGLPAEQLEVVQLSFIEGLSQSEIARKLGVPLGTVKSRMRLAYDKLRSSVGSDL